MPSTTTLAERLSIIFIKLDEQLPGRPSTGRSLFDAWHGVFAIESSKGLAVVERISVILNGLMKLQRQINASSRLRPSQKTSALQTAASFEALFALSNFAGDAHNFKGICNEVACGNLGLIGVSLEAEFSEPVLDEDVTTSIRLALNEVQQLLSATSIPIDLQITLKNTIERMLWCLDHPDMASPQDLFEVAGSAMVVAKQVKDRDPGSEGAEQSVGVKVWDRISGVGVQLDRVIIAADRGLQFLERLSHDAHQLIGNLPHIS